MAQYLTVMYFTVVKKDKTTKQYECRGYEETTECYEFILTSGDHLSLKKDDIISCVCTGFSPFWSN